MDDYLIVRIAVSDIGDFYRMLRDFKRNRGNTFVYIQREIEKMYPKLKERYGTTSED